VRSWDEFGIPKLVAPKMRLLIGVDLDGNYRSTLNLLSRLNFPYPEVTILTVDEAGDFPVAMPHMPNFAGNGTSITLNEVGPKLLAKATEEVIAAGFPCKSIYEPGDPAGQLILQAIQIPADLIVIGSHPAKDSASPIRGTISKALANDSETSFLIAREVGGGSGPLKVMFATDHSPFAEQAFNKLLVWGAKGIEEVTLFTAIDPEHHSIFGGLNRDVGQGEPMDPKVMADHTADLEKRLDVVGIRSVVQHGEGHGAKPIDIAMRESSAEMLILGARGHGFMKSMFLGSVVTSILKVATYPVLVVRP
jgi:nucleotide-binding universal stress UspA family protein